MVHRKTDCHHQLTKKEHQTNAPRPRDEQQDDATESRWLRIARRVYIISMLPPTFGNGTTGRLFAIAQITVRLYFCEGLNKAETTSTRFRYPKLSTCNKTGTTTAFLKCRLWGTQRVASVERILSTRTSPFKLCLHGCLVLQALEPTGQSYH
jgi:hypothetical protein